jgi:ABC-type multidrug transport system ATPase subunit
VNDTIPTKDGLRSIVSFVTQDDDSLFPFLTVRETLRYAACLRLPDTMSRASKYQRAEDILTKMGLKDCANTLVGNDQIKGISGGEKRRVSIAVQLLTNPRILLLDEPTSGLDGFTAQSIMELLSMVAAEGCTVILAIHQSRCSLWRTFGNVLLLARGGHAVYSGTGDGMLQYFREAGFDCPVRTNPGDFALDLITVDLRTASQEGRTREKVQRLVSLWKNSSAVSPDLAAEMQSTRPLILPAEVGAIQKSTASFQTAFPTLIHRSALHLRREKDAAIAKIMNVVPYGILISLFFAPLNDSYQGIESRLGTVQLLCFVFFMGILNNMAVYPVEKRVAFQEIEENAYDIVPYFVSYSLLELPFEIVASILTASIAAFPMGFRSAEVVFAMAFDVFALMSCGESVGLVFNTFFNDSGLTVNITNTLICIIQTMGGLLRINPPKVLQGLNYLNPVGYVIGNLAPYMMRGVSFECSPAEMLSGGSHCVQTTGQAILQQYGLDKNPHRQLLLLASVMLAYRLVAFGVLYAWKGNWSKGLRSRG